MKMERAEPSNNQSANSSVIIFGDNASPLVACLSMALSAWIIASNFIVLVCFVKHRNHLIKSTFTMQVLTLSASDLLAGLSTIPILVTIFTSEVSYGFCLFRFVIFLSAQVVVLFHILGICITRLSIVCQMNSPLRLSRKTRLTVVYLLINWITTLGIFSVPSIIWGKYRPTLFICSLNELFQDNYKVFTKYSVSIFIVPSLLTNAVYVATIVKLRFSSRRVDAHQNSLNSTSNISTPRNLNNQSSTGGSFMAQTNPSVIQAWSVSYVSSSRVVDFKQSSKRVTNEVASDDCGEVCDISFRQEGNLADLRDKKQTSKNIQPQTSFTSLTGTRFRNENRISPTTDGGRSDTQVDHRCSYASLPTLKSQRKALTTIGLLLCLYDVCVIPFILVFVVEGRVDYDMSRNLKFFVTSLLLVNSAINPIIYTWKFTSFRKALWKSLRCQ